MANDCKISRWALLKGGLNNLTPGEFAELMAARPDAVLLDCRTPQEFEFGKLKNAINFDYLSKDFVGEMEKLDREATYLVYCRSERRSIRTCILLQNGGFKSVYNLDGGLVAWVEKFGPESLERQPV
jgi:rhodanese-related sulfurtransferase